MRLIRWLIRFMQDAQAGYAPTPQRDVTHIRWERRTLDR